jgi:transcription elongation GreA/GreB family factor
MDAPLARALLGKSIDVEVTLNLPGGTEQVTLVQIEYPPESYL